jgi:uncharacterized repeat protein (TIGR03837 family)
MQLHWDIFCRVIDNYGDIGVCWRLARQLADEHGKKVRLWVDDLSPLKQLCPEIDTNSERQFWQEIEIIHWTEKLTADRVADVVIEAFACDVPEVYLQKMAAASPKPSWINLEYLTAESWAEDCHSMASPLGFLVVLVVCCASKVCSPAIRSTHQIAPLNISLRSACFVMKQRRLLN